ncbi:MULTISPECIES: hypothetical protein [unclassified Pseudomonas]|uniref:hypothetical protein n=1 Tax=unclassified Pseudomonas TaxID=196821 RepID=UPI000D37376D|nr:MULTISPECIES: hypothetical protein [unclassified Pseudomonas]RAU43684.1 hypothetical protein DBP26_019340 [Pseudomonas sp. RIT 409]RAU54384.1 hypothetical protein DBY65_008630 [Pseudomonas sp. RIT 412]
MNTANTITSWKDLSFTRRNSGGRVVFWPRNNPGVSSDFGKGKAFFDKEIGALAAVDETEAFTVICAVLSDMAHRSTNLEIGFADSIGRAAILGLRALREGANAFKPIENFD